MRNDFRLHLDNSLVADSSFTHCPSHGGPFSNVLGHLFKQIVRVTPPLLNFWYIPIRNLKYFSVGNKNQQGTVPIPTAQVPGRPVLENGVEFQCVAKLFNTTFRWHSLSAHSFPPTCLRTYVKRHKCAYYIHLYVCTHTCQRLSLRSCVYARVRACVRMYVCISVWEL